jgi:hypothetical protein
MNTVLDHALAEVDDQSQFHSGQPQVGKDLRFENGVVLRSRLAFDDDQAANNDIPVSSEISSHESGATH